jgi:hypothetical protein
LQCSVEVIVGENTGKTKIRLDMWYFELGNLEYVVLDKYKDFLPHRSVFFFTKRKKCIFFQENKNRTDAVVYGREDNKLWFYDH